MYTNAVIDIVGVTGSSPVTRTSQVAASVITCGVFRFTVGVVKTIVYGLSTAYPKIWVNSSASFTSSVGMQ